MIVIIQAMLRVPFSKTRLPTKETEYSICSRNFTIKNPAKFASQVVGALFGLTPFVSVVVLVFFKLHPKKFLKF